MNKIKYVSLISLFFAILILILTFEKSIKSNINPFEKSYISSSNSFEIQPSINASNYGLVKYYKLIFEQDFSSLKDLSFIIEGGSFIKFDNHFQSKWLYSPIYENLHATKLFSYLNNSYKPIKLNTPDDKNIKFNINFISLEDNMNIIVKVYTDDITNFDQSINLKLLDLKDINKVYLSSEVIKKNDHLIYNFKYSNKKNLYIKYLFILFTFLFLPSIILFLNFKKI